MFTPPQTLSSCEQVDVNMEDTPTFLTDKRRDVLLGRYDGTEATKRSHKSKIKTRTKTALNEIIAVADAGTIENDDEIFDPDQVYALLVSLTTDRDTFGTDDPDDPHQKEIDPEFRRKIIEAVDEFRVVYHQKDREDGK